MMAGKVPVSNCLSRFTAPISKRQRRTWKRRCKHRLSLFFAIAKWQPELALNEGLRCKKKLWQEEGREQLESFQLAPWASRRRHDLLVLLDRLDPTIGELSQEIKQEAEKYLEAQRLMTDPGVGPLTALAFILIIGRAERFQCGKQVASYLGLVPLGLERESTVTGAYHQTGEFDVALLDGRSSSGHSS